MPRDLCKWCGEMLEPEQLAEGRRYCCTLHRTLWTERHRRQIRAGEAVKLMVREPAQYYSRLRSKPALRPDYVPPLLERLRLAERDECHHYSACLGEVAQARQRFVPCVGCRAYLHLPEPAPIVHSNWPDASDFPSSREAAA